MDNKILAPVLAGIGIGWLAFSKEGQQMAATVGKSIIPAIANGKDGENPENSQKQLGEDKEKSESRKEDDD